MRKYLTFSFPYAVILPFQSWKKLIRKMKQFTRIFRKYLETTRKKSTMSKNVELTLSRLKENAFGKYLLVTNTLSSGLLMVVGGIYLNFGGFNSYVFDCFVHILDLVSQELEYHRGELKYRFDYERSGLNKFIHF